MIQHTAVDTQFLPRDIAPQDAWDMIKNESNCVFVDVRTKKEWQEEGTVDLTSVSTPKHLIEWRTLPGMEKNPDFLTQLHHAIPDTSAAIIFLCKAGIRSAEAGTEAMQHGYTQCYNIVGGVGTPSTSEGWKGQHLPWEDSQ